MFECKREIRSELNGASLPVGQGNIVRCRLA
jgi:hypothetical protein